MSSLHEKLGLSSRSMSFGDTTRLDKTDDVRTISVSVISPDPEQPRRVFVEEKIDELASSIKESGLLQPIRVRRAPEHGRYIIISGERRWRACQKAGVDSMLAIVVDERGDMGRIRIEQAAENLIREDMSTIDEATSYRTLMVELNLSQAELARRIGKSPAHVSKLLSVLDLDDETKEKIAKGDIAYKDALAARDAKTQATETTGRSGRAGRKSKRLPPGHYATPAGVARVKRGRTLAELVAHLSALIESEKRDAA